MQNLNFNDGYKEFAVNGDESRIVRFRVDPNMLTRLETAMERINGFKEKYGSLSDEKAIVKLGDELREIINEAFDSDVCTPAFGNASPFTVVGDGKFLFEAFLEALRPVIEAEIGAIKAKPRHELAKHLS